MKKEKKINIKGLLFYVYAVIICNISTFLGVLTSSWSLHIIVNRDMYENWTWGIFLLTVGVSFLLLVVVFVPFKYSSISLMFSWMIAIIVLYSTQWVGLEYIAFPKPPYVINIMSFEVILLIFTWFKFILDLNILLFSNLKKIKMT